jgi:hypothetical protein
MPRAAKDVAAGVPPKGRRSFLKKRTKKLLPLWPALPDRTATASQKSFASFLQKRRP